MSNALEAKIVKVQGRLVWAAGDLFGGQKKMDMNTKQPKRNAQGEEIQEYGFGLAVPKADLSDAVKGEIWRVMHEQARQIYPSGQYPKDFAMKYKDGDTDVDNKGRPYSQREGYAGCLVFSMTTTLPIRFFRWEGGTNIQVPDGIKCGDYVNVQVSIKPHAPVGTAKGGLYLNPMAVQLVAPGKEIVNMEPADDIFGNAAPVAPAGYVAPAAPAMPMVAQPPPMNPVYPAQPGFAQPAAPMAPAAPMQPTPHHAVLPPQFQPQQPMIPQYQQPPVGNAPPQFAPPVAQPQMPMAPAGMPYPNNGGAPTAYPSNPGMPPMPGVPR